MDNRRDQLLALAEQELAEYSTPLRKFEKMRPKIQAIMATRQRDQLKTTLQSELASGGPWLRVLERQRQAVALPFYGIAGLALLGAFWGYVIAWAIAIAGVVAGFSLQQLGWKLQAKRLLVDCLEDIERRQASG